MADTKALPMFAFIEDTAQLEELRAHFNKLGANLDPKGPEDVSDNLIDLIKSVHLLGNVSQDKESDMILSSMSSLIVCVPEQRAFEAVSAFADQLSSKYFKGRGWQSNAGAAVHVLWNLYHGFAKDFKTQERVFIALLDVCRESNLIGEIDVRLETMSELFRLWGTDTEGKRHILRLIHSALLADGRAFPAAKIMIALLDTYTDADAASAVEDARECVRTAVVDPQSFSFDHILRLSAVRHLEKSDPVMHEALQLFASGTLRDYEAFVKKYPTFVEQKLRVEERILVQKIRLLTLMTIAENNNVIPLSLLSSELGISDEEELEEFIIEAIQVNAISGKLNEVTHSLLVSSFQHRSFGRDQWKALQTRLRGLIQSVRQSHHNVRQVNQTLALET